MTLFSFFVIPYEEKRRDVNGEIITIEYCQYLLLCVLYTFDHTFKDNGGVGGWLTEMKRGEWQNETIEEPDHDHDEFFKNY